MTIDTINQIFIIVGVPSTVAAFIYIGRKLEVLDRLDGTMGKVKNNLTVVCNFLIGTNSGFGDGRLQSYSPAHLTEEGLDFLSDKKTSFISVFEKNKDDFFRSVDDERPQTKYDVENVSVRCVVNLWSQSYFEPVKVYLYNNPKEDVKRFALLAGIYIRDRYLEIHPEIKE